jgi:tetratricopeptide (TPR) repeat protein
VGPPTTSRKMKVNFRRFLYKQQRKLIVGFLVFFLILNILPFAWPRINSAFDIENSIIERYYKKWANRYADTIRTENRDTTKIPSRLERLLKEFPADQIRETHGRLRIEIMLRLLELHIANGKKIRSLEIAQELVVYAPYDYRAYDLLGAAYLLNDQSQNALESFHNSLKLNPNNFETVKTEIKLLIEKGKDQEAINSFLN